MSNESIVSTTIRHADAAKSCLWGSRNLCVCVCVSLSSLLQPQTNTGHRHVPQTQARPEWVCVYLFMCVRHAAPVHLVDSQEKTATTTHCFVPNHGYYTHWTTLTHVHTCSYMNTHTFTRPYRSESWGVRGLELTAPSAPTQWHPNQLHLVLSYHMDESASLLTCVFLRYCWLPRAWEV